MLFTDIMTRETKIGLLVGLAFIIVVGILLSEHLTSTVERPVAQLSDAGKSIRQGVSVPGVDTSDEVPPVKVAEPTAPVPTATDLQKQPVNSGSSQVAISGSNAQSPIVIDNNQSTEPKTIESLIKPVNPVDQAQVAQTNQTADQTGPIITRTPTDPFANDPLKQAAQKHGEELVSVSTKSTTTETPTLAANNVREYQAQPGDTLSRIASLLPGGATKANRDAIVKLNPILQKDPNKIIAGRKYKLPTDASTVSPVKPAETPLPLVNHPSPVEKTEVANTKEPGYRTYVVQKGDSLSKIAVEQLGSKSAIDTIIQMNKDVLKDHNMIQVNMKLKLPAKNQVATNN